MRRQVILLAIASIVGACSSRDNRSDAYGNFEATEVLVASETAGRLVRFAVREGDPLAAGVGSPSSTPRRSSCASIS